MTEEVSDPGRRDFLSKLGKVGISGTAVGLAGCQGQGAEEENNEDLGEILEQDQDEEQETTISEESEYTVEDISMNLPNLENPMQAVPQKELMTGPDGAWEDLQGHRVTLGVYMNIEINRRIDMDQAHEMLNRSHENLEQWSVGAHPLLVMEEIGPENIMLGNNFDDKINVYFLDPYLAGLREPKHTKQDIAEMDNLNRNKVLNTAYNEIYENLDQTEEYEWDGILSGTEIPVQVFRGQGEAEPYTVGILDNTNVMIKVTEPDKYPEKPDDEQEEVLRDVNVNNALKRIAEQLKGYRDGEFRGPNPVNRVNANPATGNDPFDNLSEANTVLADLMMKGDWEKIAEQYLTEDVDLDGHGLSYERGDPELDDNGFPVVAKQEGGYTVVSPYIYQSVSDRNDDFDVDVAGISESQNLLIYKDLDDDSDTGSRLARYTNSLEIHGEELSFFVF